MSDSRYKVVFAGTIRAGFDGVTVRQRLASLYKTTPKQIERLFSGQRMVLKSALTREEAERFRRIFEETGAACEVVPENLDPAASDVNPEPAEPRPESPAPVTTATVKSPAQSPYVGGKTPKRRRAHPVIWILGIMVFLGALYFLLINFSVNRMPRVADSGPAASVSTYSGNWVDYEDASGYYSLELPPGFSEAPLTSGARSRVRFEYANDVSLVIEAAPRTDAWSSSQELQRHILRIRQGLEPDYAGAAVSRTSPIQLAAAEGYMLFLEKDAMRARIVVLVNADNTGFRCDIISRDPGGDSMLETLTQAVLERMDTRPRPETP